MKSYKKYIAGCLFIFGVAVLFWFSLSNLTETPPTWMDEGIIIQTARNFSISGISGIRIDPQTIVSAVYVTTSYPVTLPISGIFRIFGVDLLNARIVMVFYIILLVFVALFWLRKNIQNNILVIILALFFIVTFPHLYGHGKNVLGEISGLFFLFMSMIFVELAYRSYLDSLSKFKHKIIYTSLCLIFIGLTVVTKPIFILLLPTLFIALIINLKQIRMIVATRESIILFLTGILAFLIPIIFWLFFQFHGETLVEMLSIYANPHSAVIGTSIITNLSRFITERQPIYTALLILIWTIVLVVRHKRKEKIKLSEIVLWSFTILILLAYLRTVGYYRYFFLAEFIALIMFPSNILYFASSRNTKFIAVAICSLLIGVQSYGLIYTGWTARYKGNTQSLDLKNFLKESPADKEIFVYQAPELVTFIPHENYSQFIEITPTIQVGKSSLDRIAGGLPSIIATNSNYADIIKDIGQNKYILFSSIGKYQFFHKK